MKINIQEFSVHHLDSPGSHKYLKGKTEAGEKVHVFFRDPIEERRIFENADLTITGEEVRAEDGLHLLNAKVEEIRLHADMPLEVLSIKDRLFATGLITEFREVHKKDKYRAREILKALGVSESYAEEILISRKNLLPFV